MGNSLGINDLTTFGTSIYAFGPPYSTSGTTESMVHMRCYSSPKGGVFCVHSVDSFKIIPEENYPQMSVLFL